MTCDHVPPYAGTSEDELQSGCSSCGEEAWAYGLAAVALGDEGGFEEEAASGRELVLEAAKTWLEAAPTKSAVPSPVAVPAQLTVTLACTFCHERLVLKQAAYCAACLAPHHRDCFDTHGQCATAGCGETTLVEAREAQAPRRRPDLFTSLISLGSLGAVAVAAVALFAFEDPQPYPVGAYGQRWEGSKLVTPDAPVAPTPPTLPEPVPQLDPARLPPAAPSNADAIAAAWWDSLGGPRLVELVDEARFYGPEIERVKHLAGVEPREEASVTWLPVLYRATDQPEESQASAALNASRLALQAMVARAYLQVREQDGRVAIESARLELTREKVEAVRTRYEHGVTSVESVRLAQDQVALATANHFEAQLAREQGARRLMDMLGHEVKLAPKSLDGPIGPLPGRDGIRFRDLLRRPDVQEAIEALQELDPSASPSVDLEPLEWSELLQERDVTALLRGALIHTREAPFAHPDSLSAVEPIHDAVGVGAREVRSLIKELDLTEGLLGTVLLRMASTQELRETVQRRIEVGAASTAELIEVGLVETERQSELLDAHAKMARIYVALFESVGGAWELR